MREPAAFPVVVQDLGSADAAGVAAVSAYCTAGVLAEMAKELDAPPDGFARDVQSALLDQAVRMAAQSTEDGLGCTIAVRVLRAGWKLAFGSKPCCTAAELCVAITTLLQSTLHLSDEERAEVWPRARQEQFVSALNSSVGELGLVRPTLVFSRLMLTCGTGGECAPVLAFVCVDHGGCRCTRRKSVICWVTWT